MTRIKKSPAYQWYPRDFMSDALVVSMTLEQEGAYRRLMDVCWLEKGLPGSVDDLWRLAKAPTRERFSKFIWPVVVRKFQLRKGKYQHKRLDRERAKQAKTRKARQLAAKAHWNKEQSKRDANASGLQNLTSSSSSSSSAAASTDKGTAAARRTGPVEITEGTFALYCRIATEARQLSNARDRDDSVSNVTAIFKDLCASRAIAYDTADAPRAIEAAMRAKAS